MFCYPLNTHHIHCSVSNCYLYATRLRKSHVLHWMTCLMPIVWLLKGEILSLFTDYLQFRILASFFYTKKDDKYQFLTGTDHAIPHLYDINTFQCYLSANIPDTSPSGAINQACQLSQSVSQTLNYLRFTLTDTTVILIVSLSDS